MSPWRPATPRRRGGEVPVRHRLKDDAGPAHVGPSPRHRTGRLTIRPARPMGPRVTGPRRLGRAVDRPVVVPDVVEDLARRPPVGDGAFRMDLVLGQPCLRPVPVTRPVTHGDVLDGLARVPAPSETGPRLGRLRLVPRRQVGRPVGHATARTAAGDEAPHTGLARHVAALAHGEGHAGRPCPADPAVPVFRPSPRPFPRLGTSGLAVGRTVTPSRPFRRTGRRAITETTGPGVATVRDVSPRLPGALAP